MVFLLLALIVFHDLLQVLRSVNFLHIGVVDYVDANNFANYGHPESSKFFQNEKERKAHYYRPDCN
jgi:hypothetical protein